MKRVLVLGLMAICFSMAGFGQASAIILTDETFFSSTGTTADPTDLIGYGWGSVNKLDGFGDYVAWKHQFIFDPAVETIKKGTLSVSLKDNERDSCWNPWTWEFGLGYGEDGTWGIGEVDTKVYNFNLDVSYLYDGVFAVKLFSLGDFYIKSSILNIDYCPVPVAPVPEPSTMLLLASGLLGLGICRKKFKA